MSALKKNPPKIKIAKNKIGGSKIGWMEISGIGMGEKRA
jgi:hypothetical protein